MTSGPIMWALFASASRGSSPTSLPVSSDRGAASAERSEPRTVECVHDGTAMKIAITPTLTQFTRTGCHDQ
jgi:hypothetical protein